MRWTGLLLDIVCDSAGRDRVTEADLLALKKRGFMQILDAEAPHLPNSVELIAELRAGVAALAAGADGSDLRGPSQH